MITCETSSRKTSGRNVGAKKRAGAAPSAAEVTFTLGHVDLNGHQLAVVGDFNEWDPNATPMVRREDGTYTATVELLPGRYRFRYLAENGQWFNDEAAHDYEDNEHGGQDSILAVEGLGQAGVTDQPPPAAEPTGERHLGATEMLG